MLLITIPFSVHHIFLNMVFNPLLRNLFYLIIFTRQHLLLGMMSCLYYVKKINPVSNFICERKYGKIWYFNFSSLYITNVSIVLYFPLIFHFQNYLNLGWNFKTRLSFTWWSWYIRIVLCIFYWQYVIWSSLKCKSMHKLKVINHSHALLGWWIECVEFCLLININWVTTCFMLVQKFSKTIP